MQPLFGARFPSASQKDGFDQGSNYSGVSRGEIGDVARGYFLVVVQCLGGIKGVLTHDVNVIPRRSMPVSERMFSVSN